MKRKSCWDDILVKIKEKLNKVGSTADERFQSCINLIEEAKKFKISGVSDDGELLYAQGIIHNGVGRVREAKTFFSRYLLEAPNGPYVTTVQYYLLQYDKPRLLFNQDGLLRSMYEDGSEPTTLSVESQGMVLQGAVSPSHDTVAYLTWSERTQSYSIYVLDLISHKVTPIWNRQGKQNKPFDISWAPQSDFTSRINSFLAFVGPDETGEFYLWIWDKAHMEKQATQVSFSQTALTDVSRLRYQWSPGGNYIAFVGQFGKLNIHIPQTGQSLQYNANGVPQSIVWTNAPMSEDIPLLFGFTADRLFCIKSEDLLPHMADVRSLQQNIAKDGKKPTLMHIPGVSELGVSSEGDVLAVKRKDELELYRIEMVMRGPIKEITLVKLGGVISGVTRFNFSPLGNRLAYQTNKGIYLSRIDGNKDHDFRLDGTTGDTDFAWSRVGNQLLWWRSDRISLCFDRALLGGSNLLGDVNVALARPSWSLDDRAIAIQKCRRSNDGNFLDKSILVLTRGETDQQVHEITLNPLSDTGTGDASLLDWGQ